MNDDLPNNPLHPVAKWQNGGVRLELDLEPRLRTICPDPVQLEDAILTLVRNVQPTSNSDRTTWNTTRKSSTATASCWPYQIGASGGRFHLRNPINAHEQRH
jgi:hypothetical protein